MHANIVITTYKDAKNMEEAVKKVEGMLDQVKSAPGFQMGAFVRTGETESVHMALFDTPQNATNAREKVTPKFMEAIGPNVAAQPTVKTGEVLFKL